MHGVFQHKCFWHEYRLSSGVKVQIKSEVLSSKIQELQVMNKFPSSAVSQKLLLFFHFRHSPWHKQLTQSTHAQSQSSLSTDLNTWHINNFKLQMHIARLSICKYAISKIKQNLESSHWSDQPTLDTDQISIFTHRKSTYFWCSATRMYSTPVFFYQNTQDKLQKNKYSPLHHEDSLG